MSYDRGFPLSWQWQSIFGTFTVDEVSKGMHGVLLKNTSSSSMP